MMFTFWIKNENNDFCPWIFTEDIINVIYLQMLMLGESELLYNKKVEKMCYLFSSNIPK